MVIGCANPLQKNEEQLLTNELVCTTNNFSRAILTTISQISEAEELSIKNEKWLLVFINL
jgi:hypothetical protein